jgi:hypothetical protein
VTHPPFGPSDLFGDAKEPRRSGNRKRESRLSGDWDDRSRLGESRGEAGQDGEVNMKANTRETTNTKRERRLNPSILQGKRKRKGGGHSRSAVRGMNTLYYGDNLDVLRQHISSR